jgi:hypothetical protein
VRFTGRRDAMSRKSDVKKSEEFYCTECEDWFPIEDFEVLEKRDVPDGVPPDFMYKHLECGEVGEGVARVESQDDEG